MPATDPAATLLFVPITSNRFNPCVSISHPAIAHDQSWQQSSLPVSLSSSPPASSSPSSIAVANIISLVHVTTKALDVYRQRWLMATSGGFDQNFDENFERLLQDLSGLCLPAVQRDANSSPSRQGDWLSDAYMIYLNLTDKLKLQTIKLMEESIAKLHAT